MLAGVQFAASLTLQSGALRNRRKRSIVLGSTREPCDVLASAGDSHAIRRIKHFDPIACQNSPYFRDVEQELAQYLSLWPLLMACSVQKPANATADPAEYIVSQFVADWAIKQKGWLGIRYFTTKFDDSTNSNDASINVVRPLISTGGARVFSGI